MKPAFRPARRAGVVVAVAVAALSATACAPADDSSDTAGTPTTTPSDGATSAPPTDDCAVEQLALVTPGVLTIGTDSPAYDPWFADDDPTNGKGFESATAYAVADEMGFSDDQVQWVTVPFNKSYAPGPKNFDFDINQISITPARAKVVDFSDGYYSAAQAVIVLQDSAFAGAASLSDLKGARIGAQIGTTSLTAAGEVIKPDAEVAVFDDTNAAKQALVNDQIDAIVVDLPTAFYISAVQIQGSTILGQFQPTSGETEQFGLLLQKDSTLTPCVDKAIAALKDNGRLDKIENTWLSASVDVPALD